MVGVWIVIGVLLLAVLHLYSKWHKQKKINTAVGDVITTLADEAVRSCKDIQDLRKNVVRTMFPEFFQSRPEDKN